MRRRKRNQNIAEAPAEHSGVLPAPYDGIGLLPTIFAEAASLQARAESDYQQGVISAYEYAAALAQIRIRLSDGSTWSIGASSKTWYRRDASGSEWVRTDPPSQDDPVMLGGAAAAAADGDVAFEMPVDA